MELRPVEPVLLLDLDCVTIYGGNPRDGLSPQVYQLHPDMAGLMRGINLKVVLFTHRSKQESELILRFFERQGIQFSACISAKELFYSALAQCRFLDLLSRGLSKKHGIRRVARQFKTSADNLVLIDDRLENLQDVLKEGTCHAIHAPFQKTPDGVRTFEFSELLEILRSDLKTRPGGVIRLNTVERAVASLPVIGEITETRADTFEAFRILAKRVRNTLRLLVR